MGKTLQRYDIKHHFIITIVIFAIMPLKHIASLYPFYLTTNILYYTIMIILTADSLNVSMPLLKTVNFEQNHFYFNNGSRNYRIIKLQTCYDEFEVNGMYSACESRYKLSLEGENDLEFWLSNGKPLFAANSSSTVVNVLS